MSGGKKPLFKFSEGKKVGNVGQYRRPAYAKDARQQVDGRGAVVLADLVQLFQAACGQYLVDLCANLLAHSGQLLSLIPRFQPRQESSVQRS